MITIFAEDKSGAQKTTTVFILLFTATLAASIFVNQIGYYGALAMLLWGWFNKKENPFFKTGYEIAFGLYIVALFVATIFTENKAEAFHNLLKRILLIPTVYTISVVAASEFKFKLYYKSIIWFTSVFALIYVFFAYRSYIMQEMQRLGTGPAVFQHPLTASQMFTYALLFCAAYLLASKEQIKKKLLYLIPCLILSIALLGTYKRTGWLGVVVGLIFILILDRKWILITGLSILIGIIVLLQPNKSSVYVVEANAPHKIITKMQTDGAAGSILAIDSQTVIGDYDKGLIYLDKDYKITKKQPTLHPVISLFKITDSLYSVLYFNWSLQRFTYKNNSLTAIDEQILAPGDTRRCIFLKNTFYFLDIDSGLTVFQNASGSLNRIRLPLKEEYNCLSVDSSHILYYMAGKRLQIVGLDSAGLPNGKSVRVPFSPAKVSMAEIYNGYFTKVYGNEVEIYKINGDSLILRQSFVARGIRGMSIDGNKILYAAIDGIIMCDLNTMQRSTFYSPEVPLKGSCVLLRKGNHFVITTSVRGPLSIFFDKYNPSNYNRISFWRAALLIFKDHPIYGIGDIDVADYFIKYKRPTDKEVRGHFHNNFFHLLATLGSLGIIAFLTLIILSFRNLFKTVNAARKKPGLYPFALGLAGVFVAFLVAGLTEWNFGDHESVTWLWLTLGMQVALYRLVKQAEKNPSV